MHHGLLTPVVSLNPRAHNTWEVDATVDDLLAVARAADELGFHHLTCSEHVAVPTGVEGSRGTRYWDPLATLSFLAAHTRRIRLATHVLVLPYHHPLAIVKRYGTLDRLSNGRLILGLGVGSLEPEFLLLDAPFADRGRRADEAIDAIRHTWGEREPTFDGAHVQIAGMVVDPTPAQDRVPIWVGGRTARSLRRAVEHGDGWTPFGLTLDEIGALLARARDDTAGRPRTRPLDVILWPEGADDPLGRPDDIRRAVEQHEAVGATHLHWRLRSDSPAHHLEQLAALAELVGQAAPLD